MLLRLIGLGDAPVEDDHDVGALRDDDTVTVAAGGAEAEEDDLPEEVFFFPRARD